MSDSIPTPADDISQQIRTNYMGFACFAILIWDHVDTFTTEVEYIWKGKKNPLSCLFLVNRYLTPFGFIVNLFAYLSPVWTSDTFVELLCQPETVLKIIQMPSIYQV